VQVVQPVGPLPVPLLAQVQPPLARLLVLAQWLRVQVWQFPPVHCWPAWWVWLPLALRQPNQATQPQ
jgi:hypothetical protein